jgi:hypothetical protein
MDFLKDIARMVFPQWKSPEKDLEQGRSKPSLTPSEAPQLPHIEVDPHGRPEIPPDDQLNLFRHLTGITSHQSIAHSSFLSGGRPAPNLGIYKRVVHNELTAKMGYKSFSLFINGCLGVQIVVAAALTAMGAAGANRSAVTAFGAINTVIAGILTFLKGSGLPNRLKYYQEEWKRVREFIEQRERDFSRPGCDLDLLGVISMLEKMYESVKLDLEQSMPDRFAGLSYARYRRVSLELPRIGEGLSENSKEDEAGYGGRVKEPASEIGHGAKQAREVAKDKQARKEHVSRDASKEVKEDADPAERVELSFGDKVKDPASGTGHKAHLPREAVQDLQSREESELDEVAREARDYAERLERAASGALGGPITINLSGSTATPATESRFSEKSPPATGEGRN